MDDKSCSEEVDRRGVLKSVGAAGVASGLGLVGSSMTAAATGGDEAEFNITDATLKDADAAAFDREATLHGEESGQLTREMARATGRSAETQAISFDLETDDQDVNAVSPAVTAVPMKPASKDWNDVTPTDITLQFALTADDNGQRKAVSTVGVSFHSGPRALSSNEMRVDTYGKDSDDEISVVRKETAERPDVGTDGLGCDGCKVVVGAICVGVNTTLGRKACISRCIPIVISNPLIGTGCAGLCYALTSTFGKIACGSGGLSEGACRAVNFC